MRSSLTLFLVAALSPPSMCFVQLGTDGFFHIDRMRQKRQQLNLSSTWGDASNSNQKPGSNYNPTSNQNEIDANVDDADEEATLKGNRFSKHAPDTNLSNDDFRQQLKENMKADLERRRREDPNRGNQPAKSYLDSL